MPDTSHTAELYRACAGDLIRYATLLVGPSDAPDVVSAAVARAISSPGWADVENGRAYLFRAVLNEAKSLRRSATRRRNREDRAWRLRGAPAEDGAAEAIDARRALTALTKQQRAVVYLTYWEDLGVAQVSAALGVSEGSVKKQLARARKHLRRLLDG